MTYSSLIGTAGRQPVQIVEIMLDTCVNTYGVAPCLAAIGATGTDRCYNTLKTCQSIPQYAVTPKTYRFSDTIIAQPLTPGAAPAVIYPCIKSVVITPSVLAPGKGIGARALVTIVCHDFPDSDEGMDPYFTQRSYKPLSQGTFFGKLLARNQYYTGRSLVLRTGYMTTPFDEVNNFQPRYYIIDSISGPDATGDYTIVAKDAMRLIDDTRIVAPLAAAGTLTSNLAVGATTATLSPAGIGNTSYPASGYICIGSEIIAFNRTGDIFTSLTRGQYNTTPATAQAGAAVQTCLVFTNGLPYNIAYTLLHQYGGIADAQLDTVGWKLECDTWLAGYTLSTVICTPTGVAQLLNDMCTQSNIHMWWDERTQLVKMAVLRPPRSATAITLDESNNLLADKIGVTYDTSKQATEVWLYYGIFDPTQGTGNPTNFQNLLINANLGAEAPTQYGQPTILTVFCDWIAQTSSSLATFIANRILNAVLNVPWTATFELDAKDSNLWIGDAVIISSRAFQNPDGSNAQVSALVLSVSEKVPGTTYLYKVQGTQFNGRYAFITPNTESTYAGDTPSRQALYGFIANNLGTMSDGTAGYKIV